MIDHSPWEITEQELDEVELDEAGNRDAGKKSLAWEITAEEIDAVIEKPASFLPIDDSNPLKKGIFKGKTIDQLLPTFVWQMMVAGLIGAFFAWIVNEAIDNNYSFYSSVKEIVFRMALWGSLISGIIGFSFGSVESLLNRQYSQAIKKGFAWMVGAAIGGFIGGGSGQIIYTLLRGGGSVSFFRQVIARTIGWTFLGAGIGVANGLMAGSKKRIMNGLIGGVAGGAAGGLVFDFISIPWPTGDGSFARLVGFMALGGGIGALIGLVEHIRKEVWFSVISGPMKGKEFILFGSKTVFGLSSKADVVLFGDPGLPPYAFQVELLNGRRYIAKDLTREGRVFYNNIPQKQFQLKNGDLIGIGKHLLQFREKEVKGNR